LCYNPLAVKVILLKDVPKVGQRSDIKEVKDGFALNFLIPKKMAILATPQSIKKIEGLRVKEEAVNKVNLEALGKKVRDIKQIEIKEKANEKGYLFAGVGKEEISRHSGIPAKNILLEHPIKEVGEYTIEIQVGEKKTKVKLVLNPS